MFMATIGAGTTLGYGAEDLAGVVASVGVGTTLGDGIASVGAVVLVGPGAADTAGAGIIGAGEATVGTDHIMEDITITTMHTIEPEERQVEILLLQML